MNCYFCNETDSDECNYGNFICIKCSHKDKIHEIITSYHSEFKNVVYAHIYIIIDDKKYHIRHQYNEGTTNISVCGLPQPISYVDILEINGFPFTPDNAFNKLKTYLLFS
jgi:hypothetical protein